MCEQDRSYRGEVPRRVASRSVECGNAFDWRDGAGEIRASRNDELVEGADRLDKASVHGWTDALDAGLRAVADTIFVNRPKTTQTVGAIGYIQAVLAENVAVVLFPEGTAARGASELPFRWALFESAVRSKSNKPSTMGVR